MRSEIEQHTLMNTSEADEVVSHVLASDELTIVSGPVCSVFHCCGK